MSTDSAQLTVVTGASGGIGRASANVAFTSVFAPADKIRPAEYRRVTEVSYLGYVYCTLAALARTVRTLAANAIAPGLLDRYLARTGFGSQQTPDQNDPHAPANLWEPADGPAGADFGASGEFDAQAHGHDPQLWASRHHGLLAAAGLLGVGAGAVAARSVR